MDSPLALVGEDFKSRARDPRLVLFVAVVADLYKWTRALRISGELTDSRGRKRQECVATSSASSMTARTPSAAAGATFLVSLTRR
jgi:hypothetical protein